MENCSNKKDNGITLQNLNLQLTNFHRIRKSISINSLILSMCCKLTNVRGWLPRTQLIRLLVNLLIFIDQVRWMSLVILQSYCLPPEDNISIISHATTCTPQPHELTSQPVDELIPQPKKQSTQNLKLKHGPIRPTPTG